VKVGRAGRRPASCVTHKAGFCSQSAQWLQNALVAHSLSLTLRQHTYGGARLETSAVLAKLIVNDLCLPLFPPFSERHERTRVSFCLPRSDGILVSKCNPVVSYQNPNPLFVMCILCAYLLPLSSIGPTGRQGKKGIDPRNKTFPLLQPSPNPPLAKTGRAVILSIPPLLLLRAHVRSQIKSSLALTRRSWPLGSTARADRRLPPYPHYRIASQSTVIAAAPIPPPPRSSPRPLHPACVRLRLRPSRAAGRWCG
jgi:hypothetical protein